jgi:hypothetical protein
MNYLSGSDMERIAELKELRKENERLMTALERYGRHDDGCELDMWHGKGPVTCSCGFNDALSG